MKPRTLRVPPILFFLFFLFITIFTLSGSFFPLHPDEYTYISNTIHLTAGKTLYADIFDHKPPGVYILLILLHHLDKLSIISMRLLSLLSNIVTMIVLVLLGRKLNNIKAGIYASISFLVISYYFFSFFFLPDVFMTTCITISSYFFLTHTYKKHAILSGLFMGIAVLFKQIALILLLLQIAYLIFTHSQKKVTSFFLSYIFGVSTPLLFLVLYYLYTNNLNTLIYHTVIYNITTYRPFPLQKTFQSIPTALFITSPFWMLCIYAFFDTLQEKTCFSYMRWGIIMFIPYLFSRPYHHYWLVILPFAIVLVCFLISPFKRTQRLYFIFLTLLGIGFITHVALHELQHNEPKAIDTNRVNENKISLVSTQ